MTSNYNPRVHKFAVFVFVWTILLFVFGAQSLIFYLDAQMGCLLCQPIKAVERTTKNGRYNQRKNSKRAFFNTESTNLSAGAGGMSDYERIKTVVSGHQCVSGRVGAKKPNARRGCKKAQSPKATCAGLILLRGLFFDPA